MSIDDPLVAAPPEPRLLSSLGGPVLSLDQDLLVIPIKLRLDTVAIDTALPDDTNAGPYCALEDLGVAAGDLTVRLHCPASANNNVRAFLVPSSDTWNLRLDATSLENGYIDLLIDDAVVDGTLEGFIVIQKTVLGYTPGRVYSTATTPAALNERLPERVMYPVQSTVEDLVLWAASFVIETDQVINDARAPSALYALSDAIVAGDLTVDSVELTQPNVLFGSVNYGTEHRIIRGTAADYAIVDGDGAVATAIADVIYAGGTRLTLCALQSAHGPQADWMTASLLTGQSIAARTAGEVGHPLRSSFRRACLLSMSFTIDINSVVTASIVPPGVSVGYADSGTNALLFIDFGAVQAGGLFAAVIHRATGRSFEIGEGDLAGGRLNLVLDMAVAVGVFDIFILAHLDGER